MAIAAGLEVLQRVSLIVGPRLQWDPCTQGILQCKRQQRGCHPAIRGLLKWSLEAERGGSCTIEHSWGKTCSGHATNLNNAPGPSAWVAWLDCPDAVQREPIKACTAAVLAVMQQLHTSLVACAM